MAKQSKLAKAIAALYKKREVIDMQRDALDMAILELNGYAEQVKNPTKPARKARKLGSVLDEPVNAVKS